MDVNPEVAEVEAPRVDKRSKEYRESVRSQAVDTGGNSTADASLTETVSKLSEREQYDEDVARVRQMRKPFGAFTQKLALPVRKGYHRHWFNDVAGRIEDAQQGGWTNVKGNDGKPIRRVVGVGRDNGPLYAFAMELPSVFWEEDMQARHTDAQKRVDDIKKAPFRSKAGEATASDRGKFYSPTETAPLTVTKG